jgi:NAD(P)-dependent dehydrogenase (short-subunit alcohol dehydrogenase family)
MIEVPSTCEGYGCKQEPVTAFIRDYQTYSNTQLVNFFCGVLPRMVIGIARSNVSLRSMDPVANPVAFKRTLSQELRGLFPRAPSKETLGALQRKKVVVFGGNSGIGSAICERFADLRLGIDVVAVIRERSGDPRRQRIKRVFNEKGIHIREVSSINGDIINAIIGSIVPDIVINCIGTMGSNRREAFEVNVSLALAICNAVKEKELEAQVIQFSSAIVQIGGSVYEPYYRSKVALSRVLIENRSLADILVILGYTQDTTLFRGFEELKKILARYPYQVPLMPDEVAMSAIVVLAERIARGRISEEMEICYCPFYLRFIETLDILPFFFVKFGLHKNLFLCIVLLTKIFISNCATVPKTPSKSKQF